MAVGPGFGCISSAIRKSRSWVRSGRRRGRFVVELRIRSAVANWPEAENPLRRTSDCQDKGDLDLQGRRRLLPDGSTTCRPRSIAICAIVVLVGFIRSVLVFKTQLSTVELRTGHASLAVPHPLHQYRNRFHHQLQLKLPMGIPSPTGRL